jgi:hypothetical protein
MNGTNFRDAYEFDPETYGTGGLLGRLMALQAQQAGYQPSPEGYGQAPVKQPAANGGPTGQASGTTSSFDAYPPYDPDSYGGQGGLLGRLLALQKQQGRYQPTTGTDADSPPAAASSSMQAQYEADQAQQAREASAARLARGVRSLTRAAAPPPDPIDIAKSAGIGLANGAIGVLATPFQAMDWAHQNVNKGIDATFNVISGPPMPSPRPPNINAVTAEGIRRAIEENFTGKFYEPKSRVGRYAETIGEMAPLVLGSGAWAIGQGAIRGGTGAAFRDLGTRLMTDAVLPGAAVQSVVDAFPDSPAGRWLQSAWPFIRRGLPFAPVVLEAARQMRRGPATL